MNSRHILSILIALTCFLAISQSADAMYHTRLGRFIQRDPLGYPDGMNTYAGYHILHGGVDPMGNARYEYDGQLFHVHDKIGKTKVTYRVEFDNGGQYVIHGNKPGHPDLSPSETHQVEESFQRKLADKAELKKMRSVVADAYDKMSDKNTARTIGRGLRRAGVNARGIVRGLGRAAGPLSFVAGILVGDEELQADAIDPIPLGASPIATSSFLRERDKECGKCYCYTIFTAITIGDEYAYDYRMPIKRVWGIEMQRYECEGKSGGMDDYWHWRNINPGTIYVPKDYSGPAVDRLQLHRECIFIGEQN